MIKWISQLLIRNKCHWLQNSWVKVKEEAITLANPIKIYNKVIFTYIFPHVNSLVFPPFFSTVNDEVQYEIQIIALSMFIWIIAPLHNQINLWVCLFECFYMYMVSHTQINAAVFIRMHWAPDIYILLCIPKA